MKALLIKGPPPFLSAGQHGIQIDESGDRVTPLVEEGLDRFPLFFKALINAERMDLKPKAFQVLEQHFISGLRDRFLVLDEIQRELSEEPCNVYLYIHSPLCVFPVKERDESEVGMIGWQAKIDVSMFALTKAPPLRGHEVEPVTFPKEPTDFSSLMDMDELDTLQMARALLLYWIPMKGRPQA